MAARAGPATTRPAPAVSLDSPITRAGLPGGPILTRLRRAGLISVRDLLFHLPRRYDDLRDIRTFRELVAEPPDELVSARATVLDLRVEPTMRRRIQRTIATLRDDDGSEAIAVWFGRRYIERRLNKGQRVILTGRVRVRGWSLEFQNPEFGADTPDALHAGRIVPAYRLTSGVTNTALRRAMRVALDRYGTSYPDYLPQSALREAARPGPALPPIARALEEAHFPTSFADRDTALRRLAFDELLALQVGMVARDRQRRPETATPVAVDPLRLAASVAVIEQVITAKVRPRWAASDDPDRRQRAGSWSARLTPDQATAVQAIVADLASSRPMLRLLQGDVGSGKTAVAAIALACLAEIGRQGALLAPTDLLARQHAETLAAFLEPLGHRVRLLTGSLAAPERRATLESIADPRPPGADGLSDGHIAVGTHALIQEAVRFCDLGLVIIDEQHRFGVAQRDALAAKGRTPHVLLMTATPIPRTLGQVFYADLDVSDLHTAPEGRTAVRTGIRSFDQLMTRGGRGGTGTYPTIVREVARGHRAFIVVPLVEEDDTTEAVAVEEAAARVREAIPEAAASLGLATAPAVRVGIVHGQMRAAERDAAMDAFRRGDLDVLVGTTVIEVGVDVPEATVMAILNADRFGIAQLHQLRGRVGRGEAQSYCVLVSDTTDPVARERLKALVETTDGFELAEKDLELRRTGDLLGVMQSGLPPLRVASLAGPEDRELASRARIEAQRLVDADGRLVEKAAGLRAEIERGWLAQVGAGEALAPGHAAGAAGDG
jgi:ATP-dependent DNA helicase RecG